MENSILEFDGFPYVKSPGDHANSLHRVSLLCHELCLLKPNYVSVRNHIFFRKYLKVPCKSVEKWRHTFIMR